MPRVKRGVKAHARHKKIIKQAKGYRGRRNSVYKIAKQSIMKASLYSYRDRRNKKRFFRSLWITRINSAVRKHGINYSNFIKKIKNLSFNINRKMLSDIILNDKKTFLKIISKL